VIIVAVYVLGVAAAGRAIAGNVASTAVGLTLTVAAALAFHPVRNWLVGRADRLVFGARIAPYELMARFERELAVGMGPEDVLGRVAAAAGTAARADGARVMVLIPGEGELARTWGRLTEGPFDVVIDIADGGGKVGEIAVAQPAGGRDASELLRHIAGVATTALRNLRLLGEVSVLAETIEDQNAEIAASRTRLLAAADLEHRRLRAVIAETVEPRLDRLHNSLTTLRAEVEGRHEGDPPAGDPLLAEATQLVEEIRSVSRGILPPVLADHGIVPAVRALVRRLEYATTIDADAELSGARFRAAVESAVYLGCQSAIVALAETSSSRPVAIELWIRDGALGFSVSVDGSSDGVENGRDMATATDRIAALGGRVEVVSNASRTTATGFVYVDDTLDSTDLGQIGEDRSDPAVHVVLLREAELLENHADVLLHGAEPDS
jgi:hypothetical protein